MQFLAGAPNKDTMDNRVTHRLEADAWKQVTFKELHVGDIIRLDDVPGEWRVDTQPELVESVHSTGNMTMGFLGSPCYQYMLP